MGEPAGSRGVYVPDAEGNATFGLFHPPESGAGNGFAVLLCPPFGWEDFCSFRSRREWAQDLAGRGHPALRIDLPATGDSPGSPRDPERLTAWTDGVSACATWLREETGSARVAAIGLGLGGLVAVNAVAGGAAIDDLVLWAVPASGRRLVREFRAFASLYTVEIDPVYAPEEPVEEPEQQSDGSLEVSGFLLSAATVDALNQLDLAALAMPPHPNRRVLLLDRDGIDPDPGLRELFERADGAVTAGQGSGYTAMMAHVQQAQPPTAEFASVGAWLAEERAAADGPSGRSAKEAPERGEMAIGDSRITEREFTVEQPFGRLAGVLAEPTGTTPAPVSAVLLNAGALRRVGPGRMWVDVARRWAAQGVSTLRIDLEGIGDSDGETSSYAETGNLYVPALVDQVIAALDRMEHEGLPPRFVLMGLCSGAYWAFQTALRDDRVAAGFLLNPRALYWDPLLDADRAARRLGKVKQAAAWKRLIRGQIQWARIRATARASVTKRKRADNQAERNRKVEEAFERLESAGQSVLLAFGGSEPLHGELADPGVLDRIAAHPNVDFQELPGNDHTLRPLSAQRYAGQLLDEALEDVCNRERG